MPLMRVVEVSEVFVEPPLLDGARVWVKPHRLITMSESAATIAYDVMAERPRGRGVLLYYTLAALTLGTAGPAEPTLVFGGNHRLRGVIRSDGERRWAGRLVCVCRYKRGDIVGIVRGDVYRVGTVLAVPASAEGSGRRGNACALDDRYRVGLVATGSETVHHFHVPAPLLFRAGPAARGAEALHWRHPHVRQFGAFPSLR